MRDLPPNMTDYLATRASFRLEVPERYNYARDVVDAWALLGWRRARRAPAPVPLAPVTDAEPERPPLRLVA